MAETAAASTGDVRPAAGMEVPIPASDKLQWISLTVPSSLSSSPEPAVTFAPRDLSGCHVIAGGDARTYLVWRIHKNLRNVLEVFDLSPCNEFPSSGLHLVFNEPLYPFAFLYKNEGSGGATSVYSLYAVTISGIAYLINLRNPNSYLSSSTLNQNEIIEINVRNHTQNGEITAVTATPGCLVIGRQDGSIYCYQLGKLQPDSPGFSYELRDDAGIGRLWSLVSRGKSGGPVQDLVITEILERKLLFALHSDGSLRVFDLLNRTRLLFHHTSSHGSQGTSPARLLVGPADTENELIYLAILHPGPSEQESKGLTLYSFDVCTEEKSFLSPEPTSYDIPLGEGKLIDLKIGTSKLWILKELGSMLYELIEFDCDTRNSCTYVLQEDTLSEQMFQSTENALDELICTTNAISLSLKEETTKYISSVFLRRLLQLGFNQSPALRETFMDYKKYISESQFNSLSLYGLRREVSGIIEREGGSNDPSYMVYHWKNFCSRVLHHWCENNLPYGILLDQQSGVFGLIRKNSLSLFRSLESVEQLVYGTSGARSSDSSANPQLLAQLLKCMGNINTCIRNRAPSALYYESLFHQSVSPDEIICPLVKLLEAGYNPSNPTALIALFGSDGYFEKRNSAHKSQRNFSVEMLLSLNTLRSRANDNWEGVFRVIEQYMKNLRPVRGNIGNLEFTHGFSLNHSMLGQAVCQVSRAMFESAFDLLILLVYLVGIGPQVSLMHADVARIKRDLIPSVQDTLVQWILVHFITSTPVTPPAIEDFSSQLSSLHLGSPSKLSLNKKLGSQFTLACFLDLLISPNSSFINPIDLIDSVRKFSTSILWGKTGEMEASIFSSPTYYLAPVLLRNGQYESAEVILGIMEKYVRNKKGRQGEEQSYTESSEWCARLHLRGFCLLVLANNEIDSVSKEQKIRESIQSFFRAASGQETPKAIQRFSSETGFHFSGESESLVEWRLNYYQWAMHLFEQYSMSDGVCRFALAGLEQVDTLTNLGLGFAEPGSMIKGRLWANVFKCSLDLKRYHDAYCAIISNPDLDSKFVCLRRFVIVLCETGATKILCDGEIPFVELVERVEQELFWKAERSDVASKPNMYKVLYSFEAQRNNWRKAASYMYRYSIRLRNEQNPNLNPNNPNSTYSSILQERLHALSTALNALHLVDRSFAWVDFYSYGELTFDRVSPNKRARNEVSETAAGGVESELNYNNNKFCVDIESLEKEYVLTSAEYLLSLRNIKFKFSGNETLEHLVDVLIHEKLYDDAFTVIIKFWKGSAMKRELERAFVAIAQGCCSNTTGVNFKNNSLLLLQSSEDGISNGSSPFGELKGSVQWETLEHYLEKYRKLHPQLPAIVAETLLYTDPHIELPLWLVHMFKGTGRESNRATLFRLYVNYRRHREATNLLLEHFESLASMRPADVINRKKMSAIWFPYNAIERLWCDLEEMQNLGQNVNQCEKLKKLLHSALSNHLKQVEIDSEDVHSSIPVQQMD